MNIEITDKAVEELIRLEATGKQFMRVSVVPGGCSGMTYSACIDSNLNADDEAVYQNDRIRVIADAGSAAFLDGLKIDYSDDLVKSGFRFENPNASKSCGCGASFKA